MHLGPLSSHFLRRQMQRAFSTLATPPRAGLRMPPGFLAAGVRTGIKKRAGLDLALIRSTVPCSAAGVFTKNAFAAAPVQVCRELLASDAAGAVEGIVINSGCANACTGERGLRDARRTVELAGELGVRNALVMSTGVIGPFLPMDKLAEGLQAAAKELSADEQGWPPHVCPGFPPPTVRSLVSAS